MIVIDEKNDLDLAAYVEQVQRSFDARMSLRQVLGFHAKEPEDAKQARFEAILRQHCTKNSVGAPIL